MQYRFQTGLTAPSCEAPRSVWGGAEVTPPTRNSRIALPLLRLQIAPHPRSPLEDPALLAGQRDVKPSRQLSSAFVSGLISLDVS